MSRTYREFGDLLNAYNNADNEWMPIQKAYELLDSVNENEIWEQRHAAADALFTYIAELEAEVTKCHELQDSYCDRIAELEHDLTNKEIEYTDLWDDALAFQSRIAELEAAQRWIPVSERLPEANKRMLVIDEDGYMGVAWMSKPIAGVGLPKFYGFEDVTHWMPLPEPPEVQE